MTVLYCSQIGVEPYFDADMNTTISWNMDLLGGYDYTFLPEAERIKATGFLKVNNPSVSSELKRESADVVLIYGYSHITALRALFWCSMHQVPTIMISDSELKTPRERHVLFLKKMLLPRLLNFFKGFLTVGDCNEAYYDHYGVSLQKFFRSPFTIDEDVFNAAYHDRQKLRAACRTRLGIAEREVLVLTVGKLSRRKRPRDIVDVARAVQAKGNPAMLRFMLVGDGEEMHQLEQIVKEEQLLVLLCGFINVDLLPEFYAAADFLVHPAGVEPFGLVVPEACCIGLPLLLSEAVGAIGPKSPGRTGENAVVFPVGDVSRLTELVQDLALNPERRARMAARSREIFEELDMRHSVDGALQAIEFVTKESR